MSEIVKGLVNPKHVYRPTCVVTMLCQTWALQCGKCEKDFVRFSLIGEPRCPYCGTKNAPNFQSMY